MNRNVKLMGDIPIGVSLSSSDVFFERHLFNTDWCGGAPAEGNYAADRSRPNGARTGAFPCTNGM